MIIVGEIVSGDDPTGAISGFPEGVARPFRCPGSTEGVSPRVKLLPDNPEKRSRWVFIRETWYKQATASSDQSGCLRAVAPLRKP